ncbi:type I restriction endonuclease subunit M [Vibrio mimicus]
MNNINITQTDEQLKAETYVCSAQPFELGQCVMTQGVDSLLNDNIGASLQIYLMRHKNGDWGNSPVDDKLLNDEATKTGGRIISSYDFCGEKIWIITEADRSYTTVLLPYEY